MNASAARMGYADFTRIAPAANAALLALSKSASAAGLERDLLELVKLRASQINGCAFCVQFHLNMARQFKVAAEKLDLVAAWREAGIYAPREMAALAWTELLTRLPAEGVSDQAYAAARLEFSDSELAFLTAAIGAVNVWNRLGVAFRFSPPIPQTAAESAA